MSGPAADAAAIAVAHHLSHLLAALAPALLGLYSPQRVEFNAAALVTEDPRFAALPLALPFARRDPPQMHYRRWDRAAPLARDECGIASSDGPEVVPDVVLVPCVGFTTIGFRLGYGGGYFDRWLAQHPHVTAVGVAWSGNAIEADVFDARAHDIALTLIVTEHGVA